MTREHWEALCWGKYHSGLWRQSHESIGLYSSAGRHAGRHSKQSSCDWMLTSSHMHPDSCQTRVGGKIESVPAYQNTMITVTKHNKRLKIINDLSHWWPCNHIGHWGAQIERGKKKTIVNEWVYTERGILPSKARITTVTKPRQMSMCLLRVLLIIKKRQRETKWHHYFKPQTMFKKSSDDSKVEESIQPKQIIV